MSYHLPLSRVKTIMKSSANVESISKDSLHVVSMAAEIFIKHLAKKAEIEAKGNEITYKNIADIVHASDRYDFLNEIVPRKITVRQYKEKLKRKLCSSDESDKSDSESSSSSNGNTENRSSRSEEDINSRDLEEISNTT